MSILDKMAVRDERLNFRRPEDPQPAQLSVTAQESSDAPYFNGHTYETAYRTRVVAETIWYANKAQFHGRRELAHRELIELIYAPVLARLTRIQARASDRDYLAVIEEVSAIRQELTA